MRQLLLPDLPALMHWFHLHPRDIGSLTTAELGELRDTLAELPPVGGSIMYQKGG